MASKRRERGDLVDQIDVNLTSHVQPKIPEVRDDTPSNTADPVSEGSMMDGAAHAAEHVPSNAAWLWPNTMIPGDNPLIRKEREYFQKMLDEYRGAADAPSLFASPFKAIDGALSDGTCHSLGTNKVGSIPPTKQAAPECMDIDDVVTFGLECPEQLVVALPLCLPSDLGEDDVVATARKAFQINMAEAVGKQLDINAEAFLAERHPVGADATSFYHVQLRQELGNSSPLPLHNIARYAGDLTAPLYVRSGRPAEIPLTSETIAREAQDTAVAMQKQSRENGNEGQGRITALNSSKNKNKYKPKKRY